MRLFQKSIFLLILPIVLAVNVSQTFADYRLDAAAINSAANPQASLTEAKAQNIIPNYSSNPPQTNYYNNPAAMDNQSHLDVGNDAAGMVATSAFNNKGDYDLSYLPRDNSPAITNNDISDIIRLFTVPYSDCHPSTITNSELHSTNTCDQYYQAIQNSCQINRDINVFSSYTYSCTKDLVYSNKACNKTLTIACDGDNGQCDAGGINLTSIASDMAWNYNYPILTISSIGDNYWSQWGGDGGSCAYHRSINFDIRNIDDVTLFNLRSVAYDDQMLLKINGIQIFVGPDGSLQGCRELWRTWTSDPNVNLIPYLRNGINTIEMEVRVGGGGEAWIKIEARQRCCQHPREVWTEVCS